MSDNESIGASVSDPGEHEPRAQITRAPTDPAFHATVTGTELPCEEADLPARLPGQERCEIIKTQDGVDVATLIVFSVHTDDAADDETKRHQPILDQGRTWFQTQLKRAFRQEGSDIEPQIYNSDGTDNIQLVLDRAIQAMSTKIHALIDDEGREPADVFYRVAVFKTDNSEEPPDDPSSSEDTFALDLYSKFYERDAEGANVWTSLGASEYKGEGATLHVRRTARHAGWSGRVHVASGKESDLEPEAVESEGDEERESEE